MRTTCLLIACLAALSFGCNRSSDEHTPAGGAPPVTGGTLELTELDGHHVAVASDPARSSVFVVDLDEQSELHRIVVEGTPGRLVTAGNLAFVVLRDSGQVATIDLRAGDLLERRSACEAPRGIDTDPDTGDLWVACAEGVVVRMPQADGGVSQRIQLADDLRDIVARGSGELWVSRFRDAQILVVRDGEQVGEPHQIPGIDPLDGLTQEERERFGFEIQAATFEATVAWRMREVDDGRVLIVHQMSQSSTVGGDERAAATVTPPSYGGGGGGFNCNAGVVQSALTLFDGRDFSTRVAAGTTLAVDGDIRGATVALAAASEPSVPSDESDDFTASVNGVRGMSLNNDGGGGFGSGPSGRIAPEPTVPGAMGSVPCIPTAENFDSRRPAVAVAALPDGRFVAQYRDPGEIVVGRIDDFGRGTFFEGGGGDVRQAELRIPLSGGDVDNMGHALFHESTPSGAACASCHPEGGDDGHTWKFSFGPRRSQSLRGGILETAPFHWNGEHRDLSAVFDDTFVQRMGGAIAPTAAEVESFESWMDAVPAADGVNANAERVDRGRQVFMDAGCDTCHGTTAIRQGVRAAIVVDYNVPLTVRTHEFQAPALHDMIYRAPYLHDGSALTLEDAVDAMPDAEAIPEDDKADLVAYLRSL